MKPTAIAKPYNCQVLGGRGRPLDRNQTAPGDSSPPIARYGTHHYGPRVQPGPGSVGPSDLPALGWDIRPARPPDMARDPRARSRQTPMRTTIGRWNHTQYPREGKIVDILTGEWGDRNDHAFGDRFLSDVGGRP